MGSDRDQIIRRILQDHRHLMTEAERCADRAFAFQDKLNSATDPARNAQMSTALKEALQDAPAAELYCKGRTRFLEDLAHRILTEHGPSLPRCEACGEVLKSPNPRDCFDCDYQARKTMDH